MNSNVQNDIKTANLLLEIEPQRFLDFVIEILKEPHNDDKKVNIKNKKINKKKRFLKKY